MAKPFFCTMAFEGSGHGWSESYVFNSERETHAEASMALSDLAELRAKLLGNEARVKVLRVSEQLDGPDAFLDDTEFPGEPKQPCAEPDVAVLLRLMTANLKRWKHTFLRGVWDVVENEHGKYVGRDLKAWRDRMDKYLSELIGQNRPWGWWGVTGKTKVKVTNYTIDANERVAFTLGANLFDVADVGKNKVVRVSRVNGKSRVNRQHVVEVTAQDACRTFDAFAAGVFRTGGFMALNTLGFTRIGAAKDRKIVTRKVGAPLFSSAGHARKAPRV